jgi:hypothetical protein
MQFSNEDLYTNIDGSMQPRKMQLLVYLAQESNICGPAIPSSHFEPFFQKISMGYPYTNV